MSPAAAKRLAKAKRIVVKIGSALLTDSESGALRDQWLRALIDDVADLRGNGAQMVLVSSGAIALGRGILGLRADLADAGRHRTKTALSECAQYVQHAAETGRGAGGE